LKQIRCTQRPQLEHFPTKDMNKKPVNTNLGPKKPTKLRFTRKLFQIGNLRWASNLSGTADKPARGPIQDPNQVAKTTIREQTEVNGRDGNLKGSSRGPIQDPNQTAKTTIRETTEADTRDGNLKGPNRGPIQDPEQKARTTTKETTQLEGFMGGAYRKDDAGYAVAEVEAPTTHRETTSASYTGIAGPVDATKESSRSAVEASTSRSNREAVSQGRTPARQGPKRIPFKQLVHLTTERNPDVVNQKLDERAPVPQDLNPTYAVPSNQASAITHEKTMVSNDALADRLDPGMLDAFRNNPFTQSLSSFFWP
jgi:ribosomal protein S10